MSSLRLGAETSWSYDAGVPKVYVTRNHPFVEEHSGNEQQLRCSATVALVDLMTDASWPDIGIHEHRLAENSRLPRTRVRSSPR